MSILIQQSFCTGEVNGIPYQGILDVVFVDEGFIISTIFSKKEILRLSKADILRVELLRNIFVIGYKVFYKTNGAEREVTIRTRKYRDWGGIFERVGIPVSQPQGWL